ncbi:helix-turn-helix domain-containing protein [Amycolatopsis sp. NPDC051373]|uniref:PucR family transcriptional regulator n=1 Tax=Amycolatopsis sp. NPDC051373 TaxID=3155801 RepID=UPI0034500098
MAAGNSDAAKQLSVVAANVESHLPEVSRDVWLYLTAEIPPLRGDDAIVKALQASVMENVTTLLHIFENDIPPGDIEAPVAAKEYAKRLAQRNMPITALVRAYRIGHWRFLQWCLQELDRQEADGDLCAATNLRMLKVSFSYIDRVTERLIEVHQMERDRWLLAQTAVRAARVRDILAEKEVDLDWAEPALGYRLRQHHLGLVAWLPEPTRGDVGLARLDRLTTKIAEEFECPARPLFVPRDEIVSWAWLPLGSHSDVCWERLSSVVENRDPSVRVCAGRVAPGIEGFRSTHRQALCAQELASVAISGAQLTAYSHVAPIALMCTHFEDLRAWVWSVLGPLAVDDERSARLRETVQIFLATGSSYAGTASSQILHKNTVQYRIRKAEKIMGRTVQEGRTDLEVALLAVEYLGSAVLRTGSA